ncbi:MAG TPA: hypothetical protein PLQ32_06050 [Flavihumibacter sp.]|nr:D-alanine--D-alanine ligase [Bacteroidota bacterium]HPZ87644.1 hypothetical protein [Flavihumibacter sp.]HQD09317.1 hypothetical protein [Flavihumibacter sp.]
MSFLQSLLYRPFFIRLFHWEYWSFGTVYAPIIPIFLFLCLRARSFFFYSAANPTIENGGFLMESKKKIYALLPAGSYPTTLSFPAGVEAIKAIETVAQAGLVYPLIAKPDIGARGMGVRTLRREEDLLQYCRETPLDFLVQERIIYPLEAGIFYARLPDEKQGRLTGIVTKEFMAVTGDGQASIRQLVGREKRYVLQIKNLEKMYGSQLERVLAKGERLELVPFGNHARGARFIDDSHLVDALLTEQINKICLQVPGFHYGRLDIRFQSWEDLKQGRNFSVIELNGAGSEPTHIYDPKHSIFFAWKEIIRHWVILWRISRQQHRKGIPYMSFQAGRQMFRDNKVFEKKIAEIYV